MKSERGKKINPSIHSRKGQVTAIFTVIAILTVSPVTCKCDAFAHLDGNRLWLCVHFIKFLYEGMILCTVCSVSEYIKGENIICFPRRIGFMCCKCLIWRNGFVRDYCQYCLFMNQNLFSNCKQLEAEHLGQESAENFATSRYCLCRGSVYLGWNTGQLWKAKWRNKLPSMEQKLPSMEQGQQSQHEWKHRICSSRTIPFP